VAAQKLKTLLLYARRVTVCAREISPEIKQLPVHCLELPYDSAFLSGADLVYACTDDRAVNRRIGEDARRAGLWVNVADDPAECDFTSPAVFKAGEMSVAVSSNAKAPRRSVEWRDLIAKALGGWDESLPVNDLSLAVAPRAAEWPAGTVYLVGFGPGDPELLTLKADRLLRQADVIFHDDLLDAKTLDRYPGRRVPVGKRGGAPSTAQAEIHALMAEAVRRGERVVRLKGGDPSVFARGGEEIEYLRAQGIPVRVVPGVSAGLAAAAAGGFSLTRRGVSRRVELRTAHACGDTPTEARTIVYYMASSRLAVVQSELLAEGLSPDTPAALWHALGLPEERGIFTTLGEMTRTPLPSPLTVVVGEVARNPSGVFPTRDKLRSMA
jgi:uroporphyrin-III C-methyltransferase/precorrin-2 dehydrogenase/sirohydrochlorin ferrochelatase